LPYPAGRRHLLAVFGVAQLAGCGSSPDQRATGQVIDDSAVTARVKTALAREAGISEAMNVNVNTYRGVVQLSGFGVAP
jgi:osmotically-inducible protein OsmY